MKVLVVGGGAAGLMAAGAALRQGHEVTVLEHMEKPAQKILVTGKGRCTMCGRTPAFCSRRWGLSRRPRRWSCSNLSVWS